MAATRYTVAAAADFAAKTYSNLKAAKAEADRRAEAAGQDVTVATQATGRVSYTALAPVVADPDFDALVAEVKAEAEAKVAEVKAEAETKLAEALLPVVKKGSGTARREALGEAAVPGWELLYDKPRQGCQVGRQGAQYALICTEHKFVRPVAKLVEERAVRKAGGWCAHCDH